MDTSPLIKLNVLSRELNKLTETKRALFSAKHQHWLEAKQTVDDLNAAANETVTILRLDVGGVEIHTLQTTMQGERAADSMLGAWLSGEWAWEIEPEEDGLVFIDRDGPLFGVVLDWLRQGQDHVLFKGDFIPQVDEKAFTPGILQIQKEATYFGLWDLMIWCSTSLETLQNANLMDCFFRKHAQQPWFFSRVCNTPIFSMPPSGAGSLSMISWEKQQCAMYGSCAFFFELLSDNATGLALYHCVCGIARLNHKIADHNVFECCACHWEFGCDWLEVKMVHGFGHFAGVTGDIIGVHLGVRDRCQSVWLTKNGEIMGSCRQIKACPTDAKVVPALRIWGGEVKILGMR
eukprot:TRINITY_DN53488_c0_g1_i1.p1 TRINITY_DN53488_c0_g1~~TRINITY_DN53488_c0_g1_i1.p1  ORF type:complete len:348 (+),score=24.12 TRINITY_DN53488_c0_g1_i1:52-1095(+)